MGSDFSSIETITLERIRVVQQRAVSDALYPLTRYPEPERRPNVRATIYTALVDGFGKTARFEFRAPATWWHHVKHTLQQRWPRAFRWLRVRYRTEVVDTGAVVAGLPQSLRAKHLVLPYYTRESW